MPMTRRSLLQLAGLSRVPVVAAASRPNVLFIAVDDLNDWTGVLGGYPGVRTPNIDRLASRGVTFTRAYCPAPVCNPSRTAILTGLRPSTTGIYNNSQWWRPVLPDAVTLPAHFKAHGYHVAGTGKIFHHTQGFDDPEAWHEYFHQLPDPWPPNQPLNGIPDASPNFDWGPVDVPDGDMADAKVARWAAGFLSRAHGKPFFLATGIFKPHLRWYVPPLYFQRYPLEELTPPEVPEDDLDDIPPEGRKIAEARQDHPKVLRTNSWRKAIQAYLACISFADAQVGWILDALDRSAYAGSTIVVLWSDHGWHLGEKQHWHKTTLWEEATRVPLIIAGPGVARGKQCHRSVNLVDLYPALLELCGLKRKPELDGTSLAPLLKDPSAPWDRPSITTLKRNSHAVRSERWRYIRYSDGAEELYDHQSDPNEWRNLAGDPKYDRVKAKLKEWLPKVNAPDAPTKSQYSAEERRGILEGSKQTIDVHTGKPYE